MAVTEARINLWESLLGRRPDATPLPADVDLWNQVHDRLNPARARPKLRDGVEEVRLTSLRQGEYVMARSPDDGQSAYVRLHPDEWELSRRMDGTATVAQLVGAFAEISGRLAPEQVRRVVADLAGGRMLEELPVDAFEPLERLRRGPWPVRLGRVMLGGLRGKRAVVGNPDRLADLAYRSGGRLAFTRPGAAVMALVAVIGFGLWTATFVGGGRSAFRTADSYTIGLLTILGLNVVGLVFHEAGHALATKHAGRRVPAFGFMAYFGIPSAFVDTTDMWMADRRHRLITSAAGPGFALTLAGAAQIVALVQPAVAPIAFQLGFVWYLNSLFNLNPLMTLDGYYLFMDWLEVPNLRAKGMVFVTRVARRPSTLLGRRTGEARLVAYYAVAAFLWLVVMALMMFRMYRDRFGSLGLAVWHTGWPARLLMIALGALLSAPLVYALVGWVARMPRRIVTAARRRDRHADFPFRLEELRDSRLGSLPDDRLATLAIDAEWVTPRRGSEVVAAETTADSVFVVVNGALEGRRPGDPEGHVRRRAGEGDLVGVAEVLEGRPMVLSWAAAGTRLLRIPSALFQKVIGPLVKQRPPAERAEVDILLDRSPAFEGLSPEARLALAGAMQPVDAPPGKAFSLVGSYAALVAAGVVQLADGREARAGDLIGPPTGNDPIRARTQTRVRMWQVPATGALALLLGEAAERQTQLIAHRGADEGAHGGDDAGRIPLPWGGPPPDDVDPGVDDRLAGHFRRLLVALLAVVLLALWFASGEGPAWAEIPDDTAVLHVIQGRVDAVVDGEEDVLGAGDEIIVDRGDDVTVLRQSLARLEFRGGAEALLCPTTRVVLGGLRSFAVSPIQPVGGFEQHSGKIVADTTSHAPDYAPIELTIDLVVDEGDPATEPPRPPYIPVVENDGTAEFATTLTFVEVARGVVTIDGARAPTTVGGLDCGEGSGEGERLSITAPTSTTTIPDDGAGPSTTSSTTTTSLGLFGGGGGRGGGITGDGGEPTTTTSSPGDDDDDTPTTTTTGSGSGDDDDSTTTTAEATTTTDPGRNTTTTASCTPRDPRYPRC